MTRAFDPEISAEHRPSSHPRRKQGWSWKQWPIAPEPWTGSGPALTVLRPVHEAASKAPSHVTKNPDPTASVLTSFKTVQFLSKHFVLAVVSSLCQRQPCLKRRQSFFPNQLVVKILTSHRNLRARLWPSTSSKQRTLFFFVTPFLSPAVWEENTLNGVSLPISSVLQIP